MAKIFTFIVLTSFVSQGSSQRDLESLCQDMWEKTGENLNVPLELKFNSPKSKNDPLFELTETGKAKIDDSDVFRTFKELLSDPGNTDRQKDFLKAMMTGDGPMREAYKYLQDKNIIKRMTEEDLKSMLQDVWFAGSQSGFLHVFAGKYV